MGQGPLTRGFALDPAESTAPDPQYLALSRSLYSLSFTFLLFRNASMIITHDPAVERTSYAVIQFIVLSY